MKLKIKIGRTVTLGLALAILVAGCQKITRPALGDYPVDHNPPGGPLKFYAAYDATDVDSIRANFGVDNNSSIVDGGASGKALQLDGMKNGYTVYPSANDAGAATDFTVSFWMNITAAQKDNNHAVGVLALASSTNFWGECTWFADNNDKGTSDSMNLKIHFANGSGDNWDFAGYTGNKRWPGMYDGKWHNVAFTYDATSKTGTLYRDGVQFDQKTNETIAFDGNSSQLIVGGFQEAAGIVDTYSNNSWMAGFPGMIDNVRLYGKALSASDIQAIYNNKQ